MTSSTHRAVTTGVYAYATGLMVLLAPFSIWPSCVTDTSGIQRTGT